MMWFFSVLAGLLTGILSGFGIGGGNMINHMLTEEACMGQFH